MSITRLSSTEPRVMSFKGIHGSFRVWEAEKSAELSRAVAVLGVNHPYDLTYEETEQLHLEDLFEMQRLAQARSNIYSVAYKEIFRTDESVFLDEADGEEPKKRHITKLCVGAAGVFGFANDVREACFEVGDTFPSPELVAGLSEQLFEGKYLTLLSPPVSIG